MKPPAEIKQAHDLLAALISDQWPIHFTKQDRRMLEAQYQVLCWVLEHDGNDFFKNSISSLKDFIVHIRLHTEGRKFKSWALAE